MSHKVTPWLLVLEIQTIAFNFYVLMCVSGLRQGSALKHLMSLQQNLSTGQPCRVAVDPAAYPVPNDFSLLEKRHVSELKYFWQIYICITRHCNIGRGSKCLDLISLSNRQKTTQQQKVKTFLTFISISKSLKPAMPQRYRCPRMSVKGSDQSASKIYQGGRKLLVRVQLGGPEVRTEQGRGR